MSVWRFFCSPVADRAGRVNFFFVGACHVFGSVIVCQIFPDYAVRIFYAFTPQ